MTEKEEMNNKKKRGNILLDKEIISLPTIVIA